MNVQVDLLEEVANAVVDALMLLDHEGRLLCYNPAAKGLFDLPEKSQSRYFTDFTKDKDLLKSLKTNTLMELW